MFYRTTVTVYRPYSGKTPLGFTKIIFEAETEAPSHAAAELRALDDAKQMIGDLDCVQSMEATAR